MGQVAPKVARFELKYQIPENVIETVFHARCTALAWDSATMDAVEAAFVTWFTTYGSNFMSDQLGLFEIIATDLTSLSGIRKVYPITPALLGNLSAGDLPANSTFAIKANIGTRGRGQNGRVFWPGLTTAQVTHEEMQKVAADDIVNALNQLRTNIAAVTGCDGLCIPHFMVGGVRPPSVSNSLVISYAYSDLLLDSQRDRLPGHKKHKKPRIVP